MSDPGFSRHPRFELADRGIQVSDTHSDIPLDRTQRKFGPIWLSPGITPLNVGAVLWMTGMYIGFITAVNFVQPYLLQEHLGLTEGTGEFTGRITVYAEIVMLVFTIPLGALSDRFGRRSLIAVGILIILFGLVVLPLARTPEMLIAARLIVALGVATVAPSAYATAIRIPARCLARKAAGHQRDLCVTRRRADRIRYRRVAEFFPGPGIQPNSGRHVYVLDHGRTRRRDYCGRDRRYRERAPVEAVGAAGDARLVDCRFKRSRKQ